MCMSVCRLRLERGEKKREVLEEEEEVAFHILSMNPAESHYSQQ